MGFSGITFLRVFVGVETAKTSDFLRSHIFHLNLAARVQDHLLGFLGNFIKKSLTWFKAIFGGIPLLFTTFWGDLGWGRYKLTSRIPGKKKTSHLPAPSNGWCLNPKGLLNGTLSHPFGTPWRVQVPCDFEDSGVFLEPLLPRMKIPSSLATPENRSLKYSQGSLSPTKWAMKESQPDTFHESSWVFNKDPYLVGGFNPFETYWSNWIISPGRGENKKILKPPPSYNGLWNIAV